MENVADVVKKIVADRWQVSIEAIESHARQARLVEARHVAMFLLRKHTRATLLEIGDQFQRRDHTTVLHALSRMVRRQITDATFRRHMETIEHEVQAAMSGRSEGAWVISPDQSTLARDREPRRLLPVSPNRATCQA